MKIKITLVSLLLGFSALTLFFVVAPTPALGDIIVCGDCCQPPYEASGVMGDGPSGICYETGNSWHFCEVCKTRNWWGLCLEYERLQGYTRSPGCGGCAGVTCRHPTTTTYTLTTGVSPAGSGTISPSSQSYSAGTDVSITKSPASGYAFSHWSGDCSGTADVCPLTMDSNKTVTAHFTEPFTEPISPPTLSCNAVSPTQINLFWSSVSSTTGGTTGYTVLRCTGGGNCLLKGVHQTTSTRWDDTGRAPGTTYRYQIEANHGSGVVRSDPVECTTGGPPPPPPPPPDLSCQTVSPSQINLSWTSVPSTTNYMVFRCNTTATCTPTTIVHNTTSIRWDDIELMADTTYSYMVGAQLESGVNLESKIVRCTTDTNGNGNGNDEPPPATLSATLDATPPSGTNETVFDFTATVTGGTATGPITFTGQSCDAAGPAPSNFLTYPDYATFSCQYSTGGTKRAGITVEREGATATPTAQVTVGVCSCSWGPCVAIPGEPCSEPCGLGTQDGRQTMTCNDTSCSEHGDTRPCTAPCDLGACPEIDEMWIESSPWVKRGETREVHWTTLHVTSCTLEREPSPIPPSFFSVGPSGPFLAGAINFVTKFTLTCTNDTGVTDTDSIFIRVLPTFKEV